MNPHKSPVMIIDRQNNNQTHVKNIAGFVVVNKSLYLERRINYSCACESKIIRRVARSIMKKDKLNM